MLGRRCRLSRYLDALDALGALSMREGAVRSLGEDLDTDRVELVNNVCRSNVGAFLRWAYVLASAQCMR